jgi:DNA invertase Pin-like site-specific DNA recombinase
MANIGYARVSTKDQDPQLQIDALKAAGVDGRQIYTDVGVSGKLASRPGLDKALAKLKPGDTLVVWKLDRLGRSVQHLVNTVCALRDRGVQFRSLTESIDTSTNAGELIFHLFCALAQFERGLIEERTQAGLEVARANGHRSGRKPVLSAEQASQARKMHAAGDSVATISRVLGVSRPTLYRVIEGTGYYQ